MLCSSAISQVPGTGLDALLNLESVCEFSIRSVHSLPPTRPATIVAGKNSDVDGDSGSRVRARDMQTIGCLVVELFASSVLCPLSQQSTAYSELDLDLTKRYQMVRNLLTRSPNLLPW